MAELDEVYNTRLLELAGQMTRNTRLAAPDATASAHSKTCGSTVTVDIKFDGSRITDYGQDVKACLLGQAASSIVAREIVGTTAAEFRDIATRMRAMLKEGGPPPTGRWADLGALEPVRHYKARHASTLLVFDAVARALDSLATPGRVVADAAAGTT